MDCPKCKIPMSKDQTNKVFKDQIGPFINWFCEKCGHRMLGLFDVKIKSQNN